MPDIPNEAVKAAAMSMAYDRTGHSWDYVSERDQVDWLDDTERALTAAHPHLVDPIAKERDDAIARWRQDQWFVGDEPKLKAENARLRAQVEALTVAASEHDRDCIFDASRTGVDQTPLDDPNKLWRCDECRAVGTSDALSDGRKSDD